VIHALIECEDKKGEDVKPSSGGEHRLCPRFSKKDSNWGDFIVHFKSADATVTCPSLFWTYSINSTGPSVESIYEFSGPALKLRILTSSPGSRGS